MAPQIRVGDVVVAAPFDTTRPIPLGRVMVFADPTRSAGAGHEVLLVHRVVTDNKNGTYVTQGDANRAQDSTPLTADSIRGQGRILVRFVGLPLLWVSDGSWLAFTGWLLLTLVALWVVATSMIRSDRSSGPFDPGATAASDPDDPAGTPGGGPGRSATPTVAMTVPRWWTGVKVTSLLGLSVIVIAATMLAPQGASGRFTAETASAGNTWTSARYGTAEVTYPVPTVTYGGNWTGSIAGTATAAAGKILSSVSVTVQDVTDGSYWNGAGWIADPSPAPLPKVLAVGTASWSCVLPATSLTTGDDYAVHATVIDSAAVPFVSPTVSWTYDTTTPAVSVTYPVTTRVYGPQWTGALTGSASTSSPNLGLDSVAVTVKDTTTNRWWNGTSFTATSATRVVALGTTTWSSPLALSSLSDAHSYTVTATVTDSGGNVQTTPVVSFSIDTTVPTVSVSYPATATRYGPNWSGTITGSAADSALPIESVSVTIQDTTNRTWWNGAAWQATSTAVTATGTSAWTYPLASSRLTDQHAYTIVASARDAVGNVGTSSTVSINVDISTGLPVTIGYPANGTVYGGNWSGSLTGTAADPSGDLATVSVEIRDTTAGTWWNGSAWQPAATMRPATGTSSWSYPLTSAALTSEHNYSVRATATDLVGNTGSTTTTFGYLTSGAIVSVAYPANAGTYGANWAGSLSGGVTVTGGITVTRVTLTVRNTTTGSYWNGASWQATSTSITAAGTTSWSAPLSALQLVNGVTYTLTATAVDNLSNSHTVTVPWTYVTTAPTVVVTYPASSTYGSAWGGAIAGTSTANAAGLSIATGSTTVAVRDTTSGLWWNGTSFGAATQTFLNATGGTTWTFPLPASAMTSSHSYSVTATATDSGANVATSPAVAWGYFVATRLVVTTQPTNVIANAPMAPAVAVTVQDAAGHVATTDNSTTVTLAIGTNPGSATLAGGGPVTVVGGVATFPAVTVSKIGTGYTLNALSTGLTSTTSTTFNVTIGAATRLAFTRQPSATAWSNTSFTVQPAVTVQDAYGNTVTSGSYSVTLTSSGGTLSCSGNPRTTSSGVATYSSCKITGQGTYTLTASATGLTAANSTPIVVSNRPVAAPTNVVAVAGSTAGTTRVTFTASNPTTGVSSYTCSVYVNTGRTSTPVKGALIITATCSASGTTITVGTANSGTNSIVVVVRANPKTNYAAADSTAVVGSAA